LIGCKKIDARALFKSARVFFVRRSREGKPAAQPLKTIFLKEKTVFLSAKNEFFLSCEKNT